MWNSLELVLWSLEFARAFARARRIERRGAQMARVARATLLRLRAPRSCEEECPLKSKFVCKIGFVNPLTVNLLAAGAISSNLFIKFSHQGMCE